MPPMPNALPLGPAIGGAPAASSLAWLTLLLVAPAFGQSPSVPTPAVPAKLEHCAAIGASADRLACYDTLAGRAPAPNVPPAQALPGASPPSTSALAPSGGTLPEGGGTPKRETSLLSKYWELDGDDKRGIFNFVGYRPNYVLPVHVTNHVNDAPESPTRGYAPAPDYQRTEAKFQISLRSKVAQDFLLRGGDLWVAYTQQAFWQIYNGADSKPFRNTDYEPEAIYVVPVPESWRSLPFGVNWRFGQLGLAHQSNGQSDPLSRSWNRVYLGTGFERGNFSFTARIAHRLHESAATDDNPDLLDYRGRAEFQLNWASGRQTASLLWRNTLHDQSRGSLQLEYTTPVRRDQPNGLRWYLQAFTGFAETLTDYNFRQTSIGAGVTFLQF